MPDRLEPLRRALLQRLARQIDAVAKYRERTLRSHSTGAQDAAEVLRNADPRVGEPIGRIEPGVRPVRTSAGAHMPDLSRLPSLRDLIRVSPARADNRKLTAALAGLTGPYGPYRLTNIDAKYLIPERSGIRRVEGIRIRASITDASGREVGNVYRVIQLDNQGRLVAHNMNLKLDKHARGKGFATFFTAATEDYYRRSGVDRIELMATSKNGGLTWARAGYTWNRDPDLLADSIDNMKDRISRFRAHASPADQQILDSLLAKFDRPSIHYPEPAEIAILAGTDDRKLGEKLMRGSSWWAVKKL